MQTDVNQAKSRSFNIHLLFFQLGLCLMFTFLVDRFFNVTCAQSSFQIINIMGISMAIISLGAIVWQIFKKYHQKLFFIVVFSINILLGTIIIIFSAASYHQSATCPTKTFLYIYYLTNIPMYFIQALMILFMEFLKPFRTVPSPIRQFSLLNLISLQTTRRMPRRQLDLVLLERNLPRNPRRNLLPMILRSVPPLVSHLLFHH